MLKLQRWGLIVVFAALAALLLVDGAQSQQHSRQPKQPAKSQSQPQPAQQAPMPDQRAGAEQSPLTGKVIPTPKSEEEVARERSEREEKAELDRKLVKFNGDLAYYTELLALVAALQLFALLIQAALLAGTFFLARTALRDVERAWLTSGPYPGSILILPGNITRFAPMITNNGRSFGIIKELGIGTSNQEPLCPIPSFEGVSRKQYEHIIKSIDQAFIDTQFNIDHKGTSPFYCFSYCKYLDIFRRSHTTRFCVKIDPASRSADAAGHPAWNEDD